MEINHTYDQHDLQVCLKPTTGHQQQPSLLISLAYTLQTANSKLPFCLSSNLTMHISKYRMFHIILHLWNQWNLEQPMQHLVVTHTAMGGVRVRNADK